MALRFDDRSIFFFEVDPRWPIERASRTRNEPRRKGSCNNARLLILHCNAGQGRAGSTPPAAPRMRGRSSPLLAMLAMLGRKRPARGCAWLRSSLRGG